MAKSKRRGAKSAHFIVEVRDGNLVVSLPNGKFKATSDDHGLLAEAFQAAVAKARELGWIMWASIPILIGGPRPSDRTV